MSKKRLLISYNIFDEDFNIFESQKNPIPIEKATKGLLEKGLIGGINALKVPKKKKKAL